MFLILLVDLLHETVVILHMVAKPFFFYWSQIHQKKVRDLK